MPELDLTEDELDAIIVGLGGGPPRSMVARSKRWTGVWKNARRKVMLARYGPTVGIEEVLEELKESR